MHRAFLYLIFLNHIISIEIQLFLFLLTELSSQSLKELFPESRGVVFPPIKTFHYKINKQLINLRRIVNDEMTGFNESSILVARDHVIIGWMQRDTIRSLSNLFGETGYVFDTYKNKFVSLNSNELWRMGIDRRLKSARATDEAADVYIVSNQGNNQTNHQEIQKANPEANYQAYLQANNSVSHQEYYHAAQRVYQQAIRKLHYEATQQAETRN